MYSRITQTKGPDRVIGTHQKIDRAARRMLVPLLNTGVDFPTILEILHFEGLNGPDGLKTKNPGVDEPNDILIPGANDGKLVQHVTDYMYNLTEALKHQDRVRASYEAAWLAHMVVDGLTPAHHYPLKEELKHLDDRDIEHIDKIYKKWILPGSNPTSFIRNNWHYIGPKGVMISHLLYELGVAVIISPVTPKQLMVKITPRELEEVKAGKYLEVFNEGVNKINDLKMYDIYMKKGWTNDLASQTRRILIPEMARYVTLGWLAAIYRVEK